jgi:hypothetical protein
MDQDRIVAVALLTDRDLSLLGPTFSRAWPLEEASGFKNLLRAIDEADARRAAAARRGETPVC